MLTTSRNLPESHESHGYKATPLIIFHATTKGGALQILQLNKQLRPIPGLLHYLVTRNTLRP